MTYIRTLKIPSHIR